MRTGLIEGSYPSVLVRIETDEGVTGLGGAYWGVGVAGLVHGAGYVIVGEDPRDIGRLMEIMIR